MHVRPLFALLATALAADDGGALTPPRGWRSWNQFNGAVTQDDIVRAIRGLTDRSRLVDGVPTSLADLGYGDVGIDDGWQQCGHYGKPHPHHSPFTLTLSTTLPIHRHRSPITAHHSPFTLTLALFLSRPARLPVPRRGGPAGGHAQAPVTPLVRVGPG